MGLGISAPLYDRLVRLRRDLHRHPELSWEEHQTMQRIAAELQELGIECQVGVAKTGIVADLPGRMDGPRIALRADTDALPIHEDTGLPFASEVPGVMHACGHDGHSTMLVGAAALLKAEPPPLPVRLLWQPAEECGGGAKAMVQAGVLDGVAMIFGGHVDRLFAPGTLVVTPGAVNASTDTFEVVFRGQQGHGARPHEAVDTIVVGSLFVTALQSVVSRQLNPGSAAVISVGRFAAGTACNVIAGEATLEGTIRAQTPEVRAQLCRAVERVATHTAAIHGATAEVTIDAGTPPLINQGAALAFAQQAAEQVVGTPNVTQLPTANLGGEDFAWFLEQVPGAYIRYGAQVEERAQYPAHSSGFDIHETSLAVGARWLAAVARTAGTALSAASSDKEGP